MGIFGYIECKADSGNIICDSIGNGNSHGNGNDLLLAINLLLVYLGILNIRLTVVISFMMA